MALNDIIVPKENATGEFDEVALTAGDIGAAAATHGSTHHTGGTDALTPANIGAAKAVTDIELTPDGTTTVTTAQLPARGIAFSDGEATFTVNLPTPDIRQSGLTFSVKSEYEAGSGPNFITVVHAAVNLLTTYELDEDAGSIDFLWDGYAWTYSSAYNLRSFPGRVLALPAESGTIALLETLPAGGTKTYTTFTATDSQPPASNFATLDTRNSIAVLDFDDATDESAVFVSIIPEAASLGSGLKIRLHWMATTATSGNVVWDVSLERMNTDLDADSFSTIASGTAAANGTSGILTVTEITLTAIDSVTAGDGFRLKVTRDANNGSDSMSGDAELVLAEVRSAA